VSRDRKALDRVELHGPGWQTNYHAFRERWLRRWRNGTVDVLAARDGTHMIVVRARAQKKRRAP